MILTQWCEHKKTDMGDYIITLVEVKEVLISRTALKITFTQH